ncbi:large conductance mechanosensitive channel protein MscL [Actinotalea ferrariae]|uniref:large conductance mechanosensitive channel protein MscL n=1 Tax=Actinotalea ferrariae TaxID=1386098 RepID=UPI001C8B7CFC|nr:large conductance mechanosensitive channel protein MscL [Actinotalea ferrariae]MBX9246390.1 large conductance mechanosensitive channel protein MscL [Actinotalea ferrariae]
MITGFKNFIMRGNVVDLAVAVVIGAAFTGVVTALVDGLLNPLVALIVGDTDLTTVLTWAVGPNDTVFSIGVILDPLLKFLLVALAIYLFIITPMNRLAARRKTGEEPEPKAPAEDVLLLQEIRDLLAARPRN